MKPLISLLLCMIFLTISCKKDDKKDYPVIYPGSYFPVYPNSWWTYLDQDSNFSYHSVDNTYKLNNYLIVKDFDYEEHSDPCYVPVYDGNPIYYYDKISPCATYPYPQTYTRWPILSEQVGFTFQKDYDDPRNGHPVEMVVVKGKYIDGKDSILLQEIHWTQNVSHVITTQEFAKNIGLVRTFSIDTLSGDTVSKIWLFDYYISFDSTSIDY
jgi:hypothetical protein